MGLLYLLCPILKRSTFFRITHPPTRDNRSCRNKHDSCITLPIKKRPHQSSFIFTPVCHGKTRRGRGCEKYKLLKNRKSACVLVSFHFLLASYCLQSFPAWHPGVQYKLIACSHDAGLPSPIPFLAVSSHENPLELPLFPKGNFKRY